MIETKDVAIVLCGMWSIWMLRNKRRLGKGVPIRVAVWWAIDAALTYGTWKQSWQAPEPEWIKCKVDATFQAGNGSAASGVVLRDHGGMQNMWGHS